MMAISSCSGNAPVRASWCDTAWPAAPPPTMRTRCWEDPDPSASAEEEEEETGVARLRDGPASALSLEAEAEADASDLRAVLVVADEMIMAAGILSMGAVLVWTTMPLRKEVAASTFSVGGRERARQGVWCDRAAPLPFRSVHPTHRRGGAKPRHKAAPLTSSGAHTRLPSLVSAHPEHTTSE